MNAYRYTGSITQAREYDPSGTARDGTWADRTLATMSSRMTTLKGFTQHERLVCLPADLMCS